MSDTTPRIFCCDTMTEAVTNTCDIHADRNDCPDALIQRSDSGYGILIHDGGSSYMRIRFCPWCGTHLPTTDD